MWDYAQLNLTDELPIILISSIAQKVDIGLPNIFAKALNIGIPIIKVGLNFFQCIIGFKIFAKPDDLSGVFNVNFFITSKIFQNWIK